MVGLPSEERMSASFKCDEANMQLLIGLSLDRRALGNFPL